MFESSVNSDSIQTNLSITNFSLLFESSVNSDSIQTLQKVSPFYTGLRVV